jgi:hypothetical protein
VDVRDPEVLARIESEETSKPAAGFQETNLGS